MSAEREIIETLISLIKSDLPPIKEGVVRLRSSPETSQTPEDMSSFFMGGRTL